MSNRPSSDTGSVVSLWRYPVKSMMGEEVQATSVTDGGLLGDRVYAVIDQSTGKVASAKYPRKWGKLFDCRAAFLEPPHPGEHLPSVRITLPDGTIVTSAQEHVHACLSSVLERAVTLTTTRPASCSRATRFRYSRAAPESNRPAARRRWCAGSPRCECRGSDRR